MSDIGTTPITVFYLSENDTLSCRLEAWLLILVLSGSLRIRIGSMPRLIAENAVIMGQPGDEAAFSQKSTCVALCLQIRDDFMRSCLPLQDGWLKVSSEEDPLHDYEPLRNHMVMLASALSSGEPDRHPRIMALSYGLMDVLLHHHFEYHYIFPDASAANIPRIAELLRYLHAHLTEPVTLTQAAGDLGLSVSGLEKLFKRQFHTGFSKYLTRFRIDASRNDVLYSDTTITWIAQKYGFSGTSSYIRFFREQFGITPAQMRLQFKTNQTAAEYPPDTLSEKNVSDPSKEALVQYLYRRTETRASLDPKTIYPQISIQADTGRQIGSFFTLSDMGIGISHPRNAGNKDILSELETFHSQVSVRYGGILFALTMDLWDTEKQTYNFYLLTSLILQLRSLKMIPYLHLNPELENPPSDTDESEKAFPEIVRMMMVHMVSTFGYDYVSSWIYDIGIRANYHSGEMEPVDTYLKRYEACALVIRSFLPDARIGGAQLFTSFPVREHQNLLQQFGQTALLPDFVSISAIPFIMSRDAMGHIFMNGASELSYIRNQVLAIRNQMQREPWAQKRAPKLFISMLSPSLSYPHHMNDTCFQSAFFAKQFIDLAGSVDLLNLFQLSDINFDEPADHGLLNGQNGIFSHYGLPKPGFLAIKLLSRISGKILVRDSHCLIVQKNSRQYFALLCNPALLRHRYRLNPEMNTELSQAYLAYEDINEKNIIISLQPVEEGSWKIISSSVSREHGSLYDAWSKIGFTAFPSPDDLEYLGHMACPERTYSRKDTIGGQLSLSVHLRPMEVILLEISRIIECN